MNKGEAEMSLITIYENLCEFDSLIGKPDSVVRRMDLLRAMNKEMNNLIEAKIFSLREDLYGPINNSIREGYYGA